MLEDMLRACLIDFGGHWDKFIPDVSSPKIIINSGALIWPHLRCYMGWDGMYIAHSLV